MIILMFLCALALSTAAAFYSIIGLMAIFAASPIPIAIMGSILEVSKLVVASWLYRNWKQAPTLLKGYFVSALVVLMFLTSMGIFGFLSKAHLDQAIPTGDIAAQVAIIDDKLKTEKENLNAARQTLNQLDQQVNQTISRTGSDATAGDSGVQRSISIRKGQAKERASLQKDIETAQAKISKLNEERSPIASELRKVEAEVGPIKYIAALIYEDSADADVLEKAVRWVTILIVSVFDPLAVIMLMAANWSLMQGRRPEDDNSTEPEIKETVKEVIKEVVREAKSRQPKVVETVTPESIPDPVVAVESTEHPVFDVTKDDNFHSRDGARWRSRPPPPGTSIT